jgi:hypothetical protein
MSLWISAELISYSVIDLIAIVAKDGLLFVVLTQGRYKISKRDY